MPTHPGHAVRLCAALGAAAAIAALAPRAAAAATPDAALSCSSGSITVHTTAQDVLQGAETAVFGLTLTGASGTTTPAPVSFAAGTLTHDTVVAGLPLGSYTVHEATPIHWDPQADTTVSLTAPSCQAATGFDNTVPAAVATVRVATLPAGKEAGWTVALVGPGTAKGGDVVTTTGPAAAAFPTKLHEGFFTVAQRTSAGWDLSTSPGCAFTVDYPADAGRTFACDVSNVQQARLTVTATQSGAPLAGAAAVSYHLGGGTSAVDLTRVATASGAGTAGFDQLQPGDYTLCQQALPAGWTSTLTSQGANAGAAGQLCVALHIGPGEARLLTVDNDPPALHVGVQGIQTQAPAPTTVGIPNTGGGVAVPNTGTGTSLAVGVPLLLAGTALVAAGRRRRRSR
ncbi:MAG TPA: hypothetical protein VGQ42_07565 [Candidatus Dormibacteraeota bacterium]|jgi:hypothetical protein|nr:hypothetical protein [Candidatus Dormibacteraeota bacterium]